MMKSARKKMRPIVAIGIGAMAVYGAYSVVCSVKECCHEKMKMITKVFKKKENSAQEAAKEDEEVEQY